MIANEPNSPNHETLEPLETLETECTTSAKKTSAVSGSAFQRNVRGVIARVESSRGTGVYSDVVVLTARDVVISTSTAAGLPKPGEVVQVALFRTEDATEVVVRQGIVHWQQAVRGQHLTAMFLKDPAAESLINLTWDDRRGEVRFPSALRVVVQGDESSVGGRLTNYSLHGLAVHTSMPLEIGKVYTVNVGEGDTPLQVSAKCRWEIETSYGYINGCSLKPNEGVVLAGRGIDESMVPWELTQSPVVETRQRPKSPTEISLTSLAARHNTKAASNLFSRGPYFVSRLAVLFLSMTLVALSFAPDAGQLTFLGGLAGISAYIGLSWESWCRRGVAGESRAKSLTRLKQHIDKASEISIASEEADSTI